MNQTLKKILRYSLYTLLVLILMINTLFTITTRHIQRIHNYLAQEISQSIGGTYSSGVTQVRWNNFTRDFRLESRNTEIYDTLYERHNKKLLNIGHIESDLSFWSIFSNEIEIDEITLKDIEFNLFVDSNGYTNKYLFGEKSGEEKKKPSGSKNLTVKKLNLEKIRVSIIQQDKNKALEFDIESIKGNVEQGDSLIIANVAIHAFIHQLGFNLDKGPYLENQKIEIPFTSIIFNKKEKQLILDTKKTHIDDQTIYLSMLFDFGDGPGTFDIRIIAPRLDYDKGLAFINRHLRRHLGLLDFDSALTVQVDVKGLLVPKYKPYVKALFFTHHNHMRSEYGHLRDVTIHGLYCNNYENGKGFADENSFIMISKLHGLYNDDIPVYSDSIFVHNLKDPYLDARIESVTPVDKLNTFFGQSMGLKKGTADISLHFKGDIAQHKISNRSINGHVKIKNADFIYHARNWRMNNINVTGEFSGQDFILKDVSAVKGRSRLKISGRAQNFLNAYFDNPEAVQISLDLNSDYLDIEDISSLAAGPQGGKIQPAPGHKNNNTTPKKIREINNRIDNLLRMGSLNLAMNMKQIRYNNFTAQDNKMNVDFLPDKIRINTAEMGHAQGIINLRGEVQQTQVNNPFHIEGYIRDVNVSDFFYAMDNFGMTALTSDNLQGSFSSRFSIDGRFTDDGRFLSKSLSGFLNFELNDGALVGFGPFKEIGKYIFRKRNLDSIAFEKIHNHLIFENGRVLIFPMSLKSSIINIDLQGFYSFESGTDIAIHIPLFNRKNDDKKKKKLFRNPRYFSVNLRAKDDEKGQVKISWDPNRKGFENLNDFNFRKPPEDRKPEADEADQD